MSKITRVGLDTAKHIFHIVGIDKDYNEVVTRSVRRKGLLKYFAQLPVCTVVLEACSGSHYWGRELRSLGHEVVVLPAQHAVAYRQGQKNDYNDARALVAASLRPGIRPVAIKTVAEQDMQSLSRLRRQAVNNRANLARAVRGLLTERGIILPVGLAQLRRSIPRILEEADNGLTPGFRSLLAMEYERLVGLDATVKAYDALVREVVRTDGVCQRLLAIPGFGPVVALQFRSKLADGRHLRRGRDASVLIGLTPRHHGTGGRNRIGSITKHGDRELRTALAHGARAVVSRAQGKDDPLSRWLQQLEQRVGRNKATIAYANKMARVGWSILRYGTDYDPKRVCAPA